jgi:pimeloyl-ACP methyl ester carboxylesterase
MPQPLVELGGDADAPILHIAIANGFPPQTYIPLLRPFMQTHRVVSLPPRALWGDPTPPTTHQSWQTVADDMLAGFDQYGLDNVLAIGHSIGAAASLLAVTKEPERFQSLVLLDPVMLMPNVLDIIAHSWEQGVQDLMPLVQGALRRRSEFASKDDAFERFRGKRLFSDWSDEVLQLYVEHGTQPKADGDGVELIWSPQWEAYYFATVDAILWNALPNLNGLVPTLVMQGSTSDAFVPEAYEMVKAQLPDASYVQLDGHGHLFPQSAPEQVADIIQKWLT